MSVTETPRQTSEPAVASRRHRPVSVMATVGVLVFLGMSATSGGVAMVLDIGAPPHEWLADIPVIDSWLVPGLVLSLGFGVGSLVTGYAMLLRWPRVHLAERLTRHHWTWIATIAIGVGQVVWIAIELIYIPLSVLQAVYGATGVALVLLPLHPAVRRFLSTGNTR
jgi:hypothetical protein